MTKSEAPGASNVRNSFTWRGARSYARQEHVAVVVVSIRLPRFVQQRQHQLPDDRSQIYPHQILCGGLRSTFHEQSRKGLCSHNRTATWFALGTHTVLRHPAMYHVGATNGRGIPAPGRKYGEDKFSRLRSILHPSRGALD